MEFTAILKKEKDTKNFRKYSVHDLSGDTAKSDIIMKGEIYVKLVIGQALGEECEVLFRHKSA